MKTSDIGIFRSCAKDAVLKWGDEMVDRLLPNSASRRTILKNAISNITDRFGSKVDKGIDSLFLLLGDKGGSIDSDKVVDMICDMLEEMPTSDYDLGVVNARIGKGEVQFRFPGGFISEFVFGDLEGFRITREDINEIKKFLND